MTTLILAAHKAYSFRVYGYLAGVRETFLAVNRRGFLSVGLCAVIAGSAALYLIALVTLFHLGLQMQTVSGRIARLEEDVLKKEIALQESDADFAAAHKNILDDMEKISSITYIPRERAAALAHPPIIGQ
ncbi:MAG: hypothetical protein AAB915_01770 [Patescibacteria group bacterium]